MHAVQVGPEKGQTSAGARRVFTVLGQRGRVSESMMTTKALVPEKLQRFWFWSVMARFRVYARFDD